jgi:hypothetical protein
MALEIKKTIPGYHLPAASESPNVVDVWLGTVVNPEPKGGHPKWKSRFSSRDSLSIKTDLNAAKGNVNTALPSQPQQQQANQQEKKPPTTLVSNSQCRVYNHPSKKDPFVPLAREEV